MIFLAVAVITVIGLVMPGPKAFDRAGCEMNCQKCRTITNEEIREVLKDLKAPEAEILKVERSPMKGLWEVSINHA